MVDHQHWLDRWKENRIGFHEAEVNSHLRTWFAQLAPSPGGSVFVPLCGKAHDMCWIAQQGYQVIGIELSQIAIEAFFEENSIDFERNSGDRFTTYESENICLLQGDFFDLRKHDLGSCELVYDRAALIALEHDDRPQYYDHMLSILPPSCNMLLVTLEYNQADMRGPPFSVPTDEVKQHYQDAFDIKLLQSRDIVDHGPRWRKVGLSELNESVFSLVR
jgi:thiopurine S-methyltransferase